MRRETLLRAKVTAEDLLKVYDEDIFRRVKGTGRSAVTVFGGSEPKGQFPAPLLRATATFMSGSSGPATYSTALSAL